MKTSMQIGRWAAVVALLAAAALPCVAAETAVLRNGFSIRHERRQVIGTITRLYVDGDDSSFVDVPTAEIDHFEAARLQSARSEPTAHRDAPSTGGTQSGVDLNEVVKAASGT